MSRFAKRLLLSIAAGMALYAALAVRSDWHKVADRAAAFSPWAALAAAGLAAVNYALRFGKWQFLLGRLAIRVPTGRSLGIFLSGFALTVTPGKVGEVLKSYLLRQSDGVPMARSAPIVVAERITDLVACLVLVLAGMGSFGASRLALLACGIGSAAVVVLVVAVGSRRVGGALIDLAARLPVGARLAPKLREFHEAALTVLAPAPFAVATVISVAAWAMECAAFYVILRGFPGTEASLLLCIFIYALTTIAGAVSPGGLVIQEGAMIGLLVATAHGVDGATASAATIVTRLCTLWFAVAVGVAALVVMEQRLAVDVNDPLARRAE